MRRPGSVRGLEHLGRVRLSRHFFLRDFLHSEIADFHRIPNLPDDPDLAIAAGRELATRLLEPLVETFGPITIRSGYRSVRVNDFGNAHNLSCARSGSDFGGHIWDRRHPVGGMGAMATVVIPWFADRYEAGRDWRDLAWWLHDHLSDWSEIQFFPRLCAFNLGWREVPVDKIWGYIPPRGILRGPGATPAEPLAARQARYRDFPPFRGLTLPK